MIGSVFASFGAIPASLVFYQTGASPSSVAKALVVPTIFVLIVLVAFFLVIWYIKEYFKRSPVAELDKEFRAEKDTLLIMAQAKKMEREKQAAQEKVREKIMAEIGELSIDMELFALSCPHCLLELSDDMEIVFFLEQKFGVHRACFVDYHAANQDAMSKYLYIHPEGSFEYWDDYIENLPAV